MIRISLEGLGPRPETGISVSLIAERLSTAIRSGVIKEGSAITQQALADHFGVIKEGSAITQQALADHFGVSRMPAREALRQVEAQGFIMPRLNRSPIVVRPVGDSSAERVQRLELQLRQIKEVFDCMSREPQEMADCWRELARQHAENIETVLAVTH